MPSTIYDFSYETPSGETVSLDMYRGKPLLIVNTATKCGLAPQFKDLQFLHVARDGISVTRFAPNTAPMSIESDIQKSLAK